MNGVQLSVLDLPLLQAGRPPAEIPHLQAELAQRLDELGYHRVWYAEHHASPAMADFPPPVVISHIAAVTSRIRIGSGGVLALNHAPLTIAEQFGALSTLYSGRIDLGIGRGPGTFDEEAAAALRWGTPPKTNEEYSQAVADTVQLVGQREHKPEPWVLASSSAGAELAAELGVPMAFAHHIRPQNTAEAIERYRVRFQPSQWSDVPRVLLSVEVVCASTAAEAEHLGRPIDIVRLSVATHQREVPMPSPPDAAAHVFTAEDERKLAALTSEVVRGDAATVTAGLVRLVKKFGADELMLMTPIYDLKDRVRSFELIAEGMAVTPASSSR